MSRFYAELHDRELLSQAAAILGEVQRRNLIEVFLPEADATPGEQANGIVFPRRLAVIAASDRKLLLQVEGDFFHRAE